MIIPVTYYRATMRRGCWKEHQCIGCDTKFRDAFVTEQETLGDRADDALWSAERKVDASLWEDVVMHPCPACGLYQPDMIGQRQYNLHGGLFVAQLVVLGLLVLRLGLSPASVAVRYVAAGMAGLFGAINLWAASGNRNGNLPRNLGDIPAAPGKWCTAPFVMRIECDKRRRKIRRVACSRLRIVVLIELAGAECACRGA